MRRRVIWVRTRGRLDAFRRGHPEGYIEAFAVLYREFAEGLMAWRRAKENPLPATLPGIAAAVRGMRFIERAIESSRKEGWVEF